MKQELDKIVVNLQKKNYAPIYVAHGQEPYFIDLLTDHIESGILNEDEKDFNMHIFYGKDVNVPELVAVLKSFPMMGNYQVVVVREAQHLDERKLGPLESYFTNPQPSTIFYIAYKDTLSKKLSSWIKKNPKNFQIYETKKMYDKDVQAFILDYTKSKGFNIDSKIAQIVCDNLGNSLSKVVNELDKIFINLPAGTLIDNKIVEDYIGISREFNVFELQKAIANRNLNKAMQIAYHFAGNVKENSIFSVISPMYSFVSKGLVYFQLKKTMSRDELFRQMGLNFYSGADLEAMNAKYSVSSMVDLISILREYDLKAKGVDNSIAEEGDLIKELVFKLLVA